MVSRPIWTSLASVALVAALAGCGASSTPAGPTSASGSSPNGPAPSSPGQPSEADVAAAATLIDAANLADEATISPLEAIRFTPAGTLAASRRLAEGVTGDALWAAAWVYATNGTDPAPLLPLLASDDPTIRAIASAGAASLGRTEGLDELAELLAVDAGLRGSHPPVRVARYAAFILSGLIPGGAGDLATGTADERTAASGAWTSWLDANRSRLAFDTAQRRWILT